MGFLIPLLYFLLFTLSLVVLTKKTFGKCFPLSIFISAFILFFSQFIFKTFIIGYYINIIFSLLGVILLIFKPATRKKIKDNYFSNGFFAFIILYIFVYIFDLKRSFSHWDEFSHWGVMVKEMIRLDKFYSIDSSTLMAHKDYPPILQIFEMFYCKLSGGYNEAYLIRSIHLFSLSLIVLPIIDEFKKFNNIKSFIKFVLVVVSIIFIAYLFILLYDGHGVINSIYNDYFMAILTAYSMFIIIINKKIFSKFNIINLSLSLSFLVLTKQMGLPLFLMIIFIYIFDIILKLKNDKSLNKIKNIIFKRKNLKRIIFIFIALILIPLGLYFGWSKYVKIIGCDSQFNLSDIKINELYGIIRGVSGEEWQHTASKNYYNALFNSNITTSNILTLSYLQSIILIFIFLLFIWKYFKNKFYKNQFLSINTTLFFGAIGYAFVMLLLYVFSFGSYEGPNLASFDRYMATYIIICLVVIIYLIGIVVSRSKNKKKELYLFILCGLLFIIQSPNKMVALIPSISSPVENVYSYNANIISNKTKDFDKIYIIAQNTSGEYQFFVKYYCNPRLTNLHYFNLPVDNNINPRTYYNDNMLEYMKDFDYLYLALIDDSFIEKYSFMFGNEKIEQYGLYKINFNNENIVLTLQSE